MWFKAIQFYQLDKDSKFVVSEMEEQLKAFEFESCSSASPKTKGWYPPTNNKEHSLLYSTNGFHMMSIKIEEKLIPQYVIKEHLQEKVEILESNGQRVSKKEKGRLKEEIFHSLLPRAFNKSGRIYAYIDTQRNLLIVDASSPNKADEFIALFRETFDFKLSRPEVNHSCAIMTEWLENNACTHSFAIEDACLLQDSKEDSSSIRYKGQELLTDYVKDNLNEKYFVKQLALCWDDKISLTVNEGLIITKIKFLDLIKDLAKDAYRETDLQAFDSDFVIMTETIREFLDDLQAAFEVGEKEASKPLEVAA